MNTNRSALGPVLISVTIFMINLDSFLLLNLIIIF
jgi:hypothetical protein